MPTTEMFNSMAVAFGVMTTAMYPDTVTFKRPTVTVDSVGGSSSSWANTSPASVPVRYRPASGDESLVAGKPVAGVAYLLNVPAQYSSALVDVDARCQAVISARTGGEPSRTFQVRQPSRMEGIEIEVLASLEE